MYAIVPAPWSPGHYAGVHVITSVNGHNQQESNGVQQVYGRCTAGAGTVYGGPTVYGGTAVGVRRYSCRWCTEVYGVRGLYIRCKVCTAGVRAGVRTVYGRFCTAGCTQDGLVGPIIIYCYIRRPVSGWCLPARSPSPSLSRLGIR